jgi:hypothetical protein
VTLLFACFEVFFLESATCEVSFVLGGELSSSIYFPGRLVVQFFPLFPAHFLLRNVQVGFGDFAPTMQVTRGFAVVLIPLGLVTLSFILSMFSAFGNVVTPGHVATRQEHNSVKHHSVTKLQAKFRGNKTRKENKKKISKIDVKKLLQMKGGGGGTSSSSKSKPPPPPHFKSEEGQPGEGLFETILAKISACKKSMAVRVSLMLLRLFLVFLSGALFFKLYKPEDK